MDDDVQALVAGQVAYYRARAPDYDDVYLGKDWDRCIEELPITGDVLELACGSGHWTRLLAARARSVTAIDAAPEMLALARQHAKDLAVEFIQADVFAWQPPRRYDTVFFAFWLTHVPPARFAGFWSMVGMDLAPGGRVALLTTATENARANASCLTRRRRPSGGTPASIGQGRTPPSHIPAHAAPQEPDSTSGPHRAVGA
jgi:demethylmenaquinone methyltransferase/2-methoxy-6-polyprenyl-1,4-benzoquinol methylase